ncbi:hypothetical protein [Hymenobacter sp. DG25B]|uniref:hypothetical protein n=1 Tax=Hymenobacter sp. DG25B TaxID=1385664 RepID=UPI001E412F08|nr:hypothetical protein [Hymenobacter sp. DG25B]
MNIVFISLKIIGILAAIAIFTVLGLVLFPVSPALGIVAFLVVLGALYKLTVIIIQLFSA